VPRKISYNQFWIRYFYALHLIHEKEQKRKALLDRFLPKSDGDGDGEGWGGDDWGEDTAASNAVASSPSKAPSRVTPPPTETPKPPLERDVRKLRARIKEFDDAFTAEHGRKPSARDRRPIQDVVLLYKEVKAEADSANAGVPDYAVEPSDDTERLDSGESVASVASSVTDTAAQAVEETMVDDAGATTPQPDEEKEQEQEVEEEKEEQEEKSVDPAPQEGHAGAEAQSDEETTPHALESSYADAPDVGEAHGAQGSKEGDAEPRQEEDDAGAAEGLAQGLDNTLVAEGAGSGVEDNQDAEDGDGDDDDDDGGGAGGDVHDGAAGGGGGGGGGGEAKVSAANGESPLASEDSNMGMQSIPSSTSEGARSEAGSSASSFEVLESPVTTPSDSPVDPQATPAAPEKGGAGGEGEGDDWGDW